MNDSPLDKILAHIDMNPEWWEAGYEELHNLRTTIAQQAAQLEQAQTAIRTARQQLRATQENWREDCLYRADDILSAALGEEAQRTQTKPEQA